MRRDQVAKIISYKKSLDEEFLRLKEQKNKGLKKILIAMVFAIFIARPVAPLILLGGIIYLFTIGSHGKIFNIYVRREQRARELFDDVPDKYTILCNVTLKVEGKDSQLDYIFVGPNGIFIVAITNLDGKLYGKDSEEQWTQLTTDKKGKEITNTFYSPVKQVEYKIKMLSQLLGDTGVADRIQGIIYLSNTNLITEISSEAPIFKYSEGGKELVNYIKKFKQENIPTDKQEEVIEKIIKESSLSEDI